MTLRQLGLIALGLCFIGGTTVAAASDRIRLSGDLTALAPLLERPDLGVGPLQSAPLERELSAAIRVQGRVPVLGRLRVALSRQKFVRLSEGQADFVLLQGEARLSAKRRAVVSAIAESGEQGSRLKLSIRDEAAGRKGQSGLRVLSLLLRLTKNKDQIVISGARLVRTRQRDIRCHTAQPLAASVSHSGAEILPAAVYQIATVLLEGDLEYATKVGGSVAAKLAEIINGADAWYRRDLSIILDATVVASAQSYNSQVTMDYYYEFPLHQEMRGRYPAAGRPQNIHYLVTGKTPRSDVRDLAGVVPDLGTVCRRPADAIGFTVYWSGDNTENIITTAHEIGHLFNAEHDDKQTGSVGYIMNSGTNSPNSYRNEFSSVSQNQVGSFLSSHSHCLGRHDDRSGTPNPPVDPGDEEPAEVKLRIRRFGQELLIRAFSAGYPLSHYEVQVLCAPDTTGPFTTVLGSGSTNRRGRYWLRAPRRSPSPFCRATNSEHSAWSRIIRTGRLPYGYPAD